MSALLFAALVVAVMELVVVFPLLPEALQPVISTARAAAVSAAPPRLIALVDAKTRSDVLDRHGDQHESKTDQDCVEAGDSERPQDDPDDKASGCCDNDSHSR